MDVTVDQVRAALARVRFVYAREVELQDGIGRVLEAAFPGQVQREVYSIWADRLADLGIVFYTGSETVNEKEAAVGHFTAGRAKVLVLSLRSGAGLDGLQYVCRTVVYGELDWSPGVHEQGTGRVYRDGQPDPVSAYFLLSDSGSDPVIADVLGVKRAQMEGMRDPSASLIEDLAVDEGRIRKLAEDVLRRRMQ